MLLGSAADGVLLEVGVLDLGGDDPVIIHAMPIPNEVRPISGVREVSTMRHTDDDIEQTARRFERMADELDPTTVAVDQTDDLRQIATVVPVLDDTLTAATAENVERMKRQVSYCRQLRELMAAQYVRHRRPGSAAAAARDLPVDLPGAAWSDAALVRLPRVGYHNPPRAGAAVSVQFPSLLRCGGYPSRACRAAPAGCRLERMFTAEVLADGSSSAELSGGLGDLFDAVHALDGNAPDAVLIDQIGALERLKSACAAAQARLTHTLDLSQTAEGAARKRNTDTTRRSIAAQIALTRRQSRFAANASSGSPPR